MKYPEANESYVPEPTGQVFIPTTDGDFRDLFGKHGPEAAAVARKPREPKRYVQMPMKAKPSLRPLAGKCVVKPDRKEERRGLIHIPDAHQERPCRGVVLDVGPGKPLTQLPDEFFTSNLAEIAGDKLRAPVELGVGDRVCYAWATGHRLEFAGEEVLVIDQDQVLCVIEGED